MPKLRGEEQWVGACIKAALQDVEVRQHDDGSHPGMHDLDLVRDGERFAAVEVTAAADPESITLWRLMNNSDERWIEPDLVGGWSVALLPSTRAKRLRSELPSLLGELENLGVKRISGASSSTDPLVRLAGELGIADAHQGGTSYPGSIYITIELGTERSGGWVADTGDALAQWVSDWLLESKRADNLRKLGRSGASERHLFVIFPGFTTAPFSVTDLLMRHEAPLPTVPPALPAEVTHLWTMSTWSSGDGFRWSPDDGWSRFSKIFEVADSI